VKGSITSLLMPEERRKVGGRIIQRDPSQTANVLTGNHPCFHHHLKQLDRDHLVNVSATTVDILATSHATAHSEGSMQKHQGEDKELVCREMLHWNPGEL